MVFEYRQHLIRQQLGLEPGFRSQHRITEYCGGENMVKTDKLLEGGNFIGVQDVAGGAQEFWVVNEGKIEHSAQYDKDNLVIGVSREPDGAPKDLRINVTSLRGLDKAFGRDTAEWVGKRVKVEAVKVAVRGEMVSTLFVSPAGA